jgi:hypothetical protein
MTVFGDEAGGIGTNERGWIEDDLPIGPDSEPAVDDMDGNGLIVFLLLR